MPKEWFGSLSRLFRCGWPKDWCAGRLILFEPAGHKRCLTSPGPSGETGAHTNIRTHRPKVYAIAILSAGATKRREMASGWWSEAPIDAKHMAWLLGGGLRAPEATKRIGLPGNGLRAP